MKSFTTSLVALAALTISVDAQTAVCSAADFSSIKTWMAACDSITTGAAAKCANRACHSALHRLEEQDTKDCWVANGGAVSAFDKYAALDAFCHGEGPDPEARASDADVAANATTPAPVAICSDEDGLSIFTWMNACDSVQGDLAAKCANAACHAALHRLEEEETHACWEFLGLGTHEDFEKYEVIDAFCHGEHSGEHDH